jgi:hypothetical protein
MNYLRNIWSSAADAAIVADCLNEISWGRECNDIETLAHVALARVFFHAFVVIQSVLND